MGRIRLKIPTIGQELTMAGQKTKYRCIVCGYIYDPDKGDPTSGILSGVEFSALPDDWVCPECGAGKDQFEEVTE